MAVILYDEAESGRRAVRALSAASDADDAGAPLDVRLWRLDILAGPEMRQTAGRDIMAADLVLLSLNNPDGLPPELGDWLAGAFRQRRGMGGAVATHCLRPAPVLRAGLLAPTGTGTLAALELAAHEAGLDFLVLGSCQGRGEPNCGLEAMRRRAETVTPLLEEILQWPDTRTARPRANLP